MTEDPMMPRDTRASLPMTLLRAREAVMARFRPMLAANGINEQQWRVIRVLAEAGALDASELAQRANILAPSLTRMIRALSDRGLVRRGRDRADGRRVVLTATPAALDLIRVVAPQSRAIYEEIEAAFGPGQVALLVGLLNGLADALPRPSAAVAEAPLGDPAVEDL